MRSQVRNGSEKAIGMISEGLGIQESLLGKDRIETGLKGKRGVPANRRVHRTHKGPETELSMVMAVQRSDAEKTGAICREPSGSGRGARAWS